MGPMALMPNLHSSSNSEPTIINQHIGGINPFTPVYMNKPSGLPVYIDDILDDIQTVVRPIKCIGKNVNTFSYSFSE